MSVPFYTPMRGTGRSIGPGCYNPVVESNARGVTRFSAVKRYVDVPITPRNNYKSQYAYLTNPSKKPPVKKISRVAMSKTIARLSTPKFVNTRPQDTPDIQNPNKNNNLNENHKVRFPHPPSNSFYAYSPSEQDTKYTITGGSRPQTPFRHDSQTPVDHHSVNANTLTSPVFKLPNGTNLTLQSNLIYSDS